MDTAAEASSHGLIYTIMMFMGYGIAFSYLLISLAKREVKYLRKDHERDLKYVEERMERGFTRLRDENVELRRELREAKKQN